MQKITLIGNLGKDPEERITNNGSKLITFSLAVTARKEEIVWYECTLWNKRVEMFLGILPYLKKGSKILIMGDLLPADLYQDKSGAHKIKMKVNPFLIEFVVSPKEKSPKYELKEMGLF